MLYENVLKKIPDNVSDSHSRSCFGVAFFGVARNTAARDTLILVRPT